MLRIEKVSLQGFKSFCDPTEVVFDEEGITAVVGPNGCGKCVDGETLVALSDGREVRIRELVDQALSRAVGVERLSDGVLTRENPDAIEILSLNPITLRLETRPVAAFIKREATPSLLRIRTRSGREVTATPYHPLFTLERGRLRALKAEELKAGVRIAVPRRLPVASRTVELKASEVYRQFRDTDRVYIPSTAGLRAWSETTRTRFESQAQWMRIANVSQRTLKGLRAGQGVNTLSLSKLAQVAQSEPPLSGMLKSQGSVEIKMPALFSPDLARFLGLLIAEGRNNDSSQIWFVNSDPAINAEYVRLANDLFKLPVRQYQYKENAVDCIIYSRALGAALGRLFNFQVGSKSADKEVPPQVFEADEEIKWAFLSGLFEGDAYISARMQAAGKRPMAYLEFTTASRKLARQVISLLLQLGIFPQLHKREKEATNSLSRQRRTYYSVLIYGSEQVRLTASHLTFAGAKREHLRFLCELPPANNPNLDLVPSATTLVREAARIAGCKVKPHRRESPKFAAYVEGRCEASRGGLLEARDVIMRHGSTAEQARPYLDRLQMLATSDIYWDQIVSIEQVEPADPWVYDLSIAETHNFVAGNMIVHNSNLSEAISWVIGEQRARALRGGKMEDVIFQGSRNRPPAGMAEVTLTMVVRETFEVRSENEPAPAEGEAEPAVATAAESVANESAAEGAAPETIRVKRRRRALPPASRVFQEGERVTVGRRLYRTGESEYEMNGRSCRLREIQDLFAGTGLGGAHYAIIEQGRIGQVLSAKPLDRRALIEEAAGVSKFKMRQHAAELKLEASRQNLSRVTDIIAEIERQQNRLKRQAALARRHQRLREEMRELMRAVYVADYRASRDALARISAEWESVSGGESQALARILHLEGEQGRLAQSSREAEARLEEARQAASQVELEAARARQQHSYLEEQLQATGARAAQSARDREAINERRAFIEEETSRLREELQQIEGEIERANAALMADEKTYREQVEGDRESEGRLDAARHRVYEMATHLERWRQLQRQFGEAVERGERRLSGLGVERERALAQAATSESEHAEFEARHGETEQQRSEVSARLASFENLLAALREVRQAGQTSLSAMQRELTAVEHRHKSLVELDERRAYFSEAVQLLTREIDHPFRILGTLADFVHVAPEHEPLIESALRDELQYILVPSFDDALQAIEHLKAEGGGRATFLVAGLHGGEHANVIDSERVPEERNGITAPEPGENGHHPGGGSIETEAPVLLSMLNLRPEFADAFAQAMPRLAAARILGSAAEAIEASLADGASSIYLTRDGERAVAGRLIAGGGGAEKGSGVLALKREITELDVRLGALVSEARAAEDGLQKVESELAAVEEQRFELDTQLRQIEQALAVMRERRGQHERERERISTHLRVVAQEIAQVEAERAEAQGKLAHATSQIMEAERAHEEGEAAVAAAQGEVAAARRMTEERSQELAGRRAEFAALSERRRGLQNDLQRLEGESHELHNRLNRSRIETLEADEQLSKLEEMFASTSGELETLAATQARRTGDLEARASTLAEVRAQIERLEAELRAGREEAAEAREKRAGLEIERARLSSGIEHISEACRHELGEQITEVVARLEAVEATRSGAPTALAPERSEIELEVEDDEEDEAFEISFWQVPEDFDLERAKARLDELRAKIEGLGAINMVALAELTEVEERYLFLTSQKADIEKAVADTQAAIAEIKRRSRERFAEAFRVINANFTEMFQELFGGGRGEMRLIDETDLLESGIEIIAQPPGKRLQNVLLLSGGEKAMAAIALVLAIFKYRPSPFCILDEVDAPLDEVNIGRFADKVVEMSRQTQFVIITHNKRTMESARTLYGVTMEDPGVSKLLSVRLT